MLDTPLDHKEFLSDWRFMIYVFNTYNNCRPLLKVIHTTLESRSPYRNYEEWKQDVLEIIMEDNRKGCDAE